LRRAVTIIRRSDGLYSVRQYPLLLALVDIDSAAGRLDAARSGLLQATRVVARAHRDDWRAEVSSLGEIGGWLCRIGDFPGARRTYREALGTLELRNDAVLQADTMVAFARCCLLELSAEGVETAPGTFDHYRGRVQRTERMNPENPAFRAHVSRLLRWDGEQALRRAAAIAESGRLEPRHAMSVLLQAGDWFQAKDHYRAARTYYARADAIALSLNAQSPLATPVQVLYPIPALVLRARGAAPVEGTDRSVEVEFRVQADGSIDNGKVIERELGKSTVDEVLSALRVARYRPRFEAGQAVDTEGVRRRQSIPQVR
jgi:hypothetical protein